jgi:spectinomycin phosphotransferase
MLTEPALAHESIVACLYDGYGLRIAQVTFLPIGADYYSAVYRVAADDGTPYLLKLRSGDFDEVAADLPAWLHAQGIRRVMAPIPTTTQRLQVSAHDFDWILYPYFAGKNGFQTPLSPRHWITLGKSVAAVHACELPTELGARVPREAFSPRWRDCVRAYDEQAETRTYDDPIARELAAFWLAKRDEIRAIVGRAEQLGCALQSSARDFVVCHADLHAGNVLVGDGDELAIVDWDTLILAPKERDLMFIGGGVGAEWSEAWQEALFYQGYGATAIDLVSLAYYRYERIVEDLAAYGTQIFEAQGGVEDRAKGLRSVMNQFHPDNVIPIAHRTYQRLI